MHQFELPAGTRIASADIQVSYLDRVLSFYTKQLGFQTIETVDGVALLSANGNLPYQLRLVERVDASPKPANSTGLFHLAIRLPDRTALANLLVHMIENRTRIQGASDHLVSEAVYLADPEDNGLELYFDRARELWPRSGDQIEMATKPLDFDDLLRQAGSGSVGWQGIDPATDIGHIHLQVADLAQTENFYHSILGFQVTQRSYPGALFFAAGGYHHHIGANIWNSRGALPPPEDAVGLLSYRIDVPQKGLLESLVRQLDAAHISYDVRGNASGGSSLWVRDPSANLVELDFDLSKTD